MIYRLIIDNTIVNQSCTFNIVIFTKYTIDTVHYISKDLKERQDNIHHIGVIVFKKM